MLFRSYVPHGPLSEVVEDFWLYEDYVGEHPHETILPTGTFEIVFNLREDELRIYDACNPGTCRRFSGAVISGPYAGSFMSDAAEESSLLGAHFKPGGAFALLGFPAGELANAHLDLQAAWGPVARTLREQLCGLCQPAQRFRLLEQFLLRRLFAGPDRHGAVRRGLDVLLRTQGRERIRDIARAVDLSQRRFTDLFTKEVGLTPKLFGRVRRFQNTVSGLGCAAKIDWAEFAIEFGYFDQSHLIHEFTEFTSLSPTDYWRRRRQLRHAGAHMKRHHLPLSG